MTNKITKKVEGLRPGARVDLFTIDLNPIGFNVLLHFQQADALGGTVWFGGKEFQPRPIKITGFKRDSSEAPPEPLMTIANVDKGGYALLRDYGELLGAKVTRIRTLAQFLDKLPDGTANPSADSSAQFLPEIWYVEQKQSANRIQVQFRLRSILDLNGKKLPNRTILKDVCQREYRVWDATAGVFRYSPRRACPYTGTNYFKRDGTPTTNPAEDNCGKDPGSCKLRFGEQSLPGWFFPGIQRIPKNG